VAKIEIVSRTGDAVQSGFSIAEISPYLSVIVSAYCDVTQKSLLIPCALSSSRPTFSSTFRHYFLFPGAKKGGACFILLAVVLILIRRSRRLKKRDAHFS
jgi:hypothetical protein